MAHGLSVGMSGVPFVVHDTQRGYVPGRYGQLHYRLSRPAQDSALPPLLLLHQNPSSSLEYRHLIDAMRSDRTVLAFDTPGYGMSDAPPAPVGMADYAACFADAIDALAPLLPGPFDLYGYHTGTLLALELALAAPHQIRRLVLSGIPMRPPEEQAERYRAAQDFAPLDEDGTVAIDLATKLWAYVVAARRPGVTLDEAAALWVDKLKPLDRAAWAYLGVWSYDYQARLPMVAHPVLLLQPDEEIAAASIAAAGLIPSALVERLAGFDRDIFHLPDSVAAIAVAMRRYLDHPLSSGVQA
ncbi:alpha/beta fold hydrolase [Sphingobium sp. CR2-8]|uniref:alpha/beta fold hydrolase n=1 Tax=Sphingobium sp. CR2-8 TaxID=1306534 RepID=UPI002DBA3880|nr:alpha/beta fold hydrolase [Sphingobium sp. CR2-8]MEC3911473.1 alpha/beta fold hydrolase [Sphingobium sp. CR2-8]